MGNLMSSPHSWVATEASAPWQTESNWNPTGKPGLEWDVTLANTSSSTKEAIVSSDSTVNSIDISATISSMNLEVQSGAVLSVNQQIIIGPGGVVDIQGLMSTNSCYCLAKP